MNSKQAFAAMEKLAKGKGWSLAQWADKAGMAVSSLYRFRKGKEKLTLERAGRLIKPLGVKFGILTPENKSQ